MVKVIARYKIKKEHIPQVYELLRAMALAARLEAGNRRYDIYADLQNPECILLDELYLDQTALDAHRKSAHFQNFVLTKIVPLLDERTVEVATD